MAAKSAFVQTIYERAIDAGLTDAAARVMAAQAAIESGYGERAPGHNYFAITKGDLWTGPTIKRTDKDGKGNPIVQEFRSYGSDDEGIADRIAFMDQRFPGFNQAATTEEALAALQNGVKGKYYEAPREQYEATVKGITKSYLGDVPVHDHPVPPADVPFSPNTFLGGKQYGKPGGGVGVNADKLHPEFANRMAALVQAAEAATGEQVSIFEGYRDPARQAQLRANYLNQPIQWEGKTYTPNGKGYKAAPPGASQHQLGMATDIRVGPEPDKEPSGPAFDFMREHAAEYGLHWFGSSDPAHFEMPDADYKTALKGGEVTKFKLPTQPKGETAVASAVDISPGGSYTVKSGDNLTKIAKAHGTTVEALTASNSLSNPNKLSVGQRLNVGGQSEAPPLPRPRPTLGGKGTLAQALQSENAPAAFGVRGNKGATRWDEHASATDEYPVTGRGDIREDDRLMTLAGPARTLGAPPSGNTLGATMPSQAGGSGLQETRYGRPAVASPPPVGPGAALAGMAGMAGGGNPQRIPQAGGSGLQETRYGTPAVSPQAPIPAPPAAPAVEAPAPSGGGFDIGNMLGGLGNAVQGGLNTLGTKAQEAGKTLGTTATNVVEGTKTALGNTAAATKDLLANELMGTVGGRTLLFNTMMGITPAKTADQRRDDRNASAPEGYGYGATGRKLYKIGQTYNSSRGQVVFDGSKFVPSATQVRSSVDIPTGGRAPTATITTPPRPSGRTAASVGETFDSVWNEARG